MKDNMAQKVALTTNESNFDARQMMKIIATGALQVRNVGSPGWSHKGQI